MPAVDLPAFTLLGTYPGEMVDASTYEHRLPSEDKAYAFWMWKSAFRFRNEGPRRSGALIPRRSRDPASAPSFAPYVNEAPVDADYNVVAVTTWAYPLEGVPTRDDPERYAVVEFYTCRDVKAGDELYVWYGSSYARGYSAASELAHCESNKELYLGPAGKPQCQVVRREGG